jgi:hypothetical protein
MALCLKAECVWGPAQFRELMGWLEGRASPAVCKHYPAAPAVTTEQTNLTLIRDLPDAASHRQLDQRPD